MVFFGDEESSFGVLLGEFFEWEIGGIWIEEVVFFFFVEDGDDLVGEDVGCVWNVIFGMVEIKEVEFVIVVESGGDFEIGGVDECCEDVIDVIFGVVVCFECVCGVVVFVSLLSVGEVGGFDVLVEDFCVGKIVDFV